MEGIFEDINRISNKKDTHKVKECPPVQKIGDRKRELQKAKARGHLTGKPDSFHRFLLEAVENLDRGSQKEKRK